MSPFKHVGWVAAIGLVAFGITFWPWGMLVFAPLVWLAWRDWRQ